MAIKWNWALLLKAWGYWRKYSPDLKEFILAVEAANSALPGPEKKAAVQAAVREFFEGAAKGVKELTPELIEALVMISGPLVDAWVKLYNAIKAFSHKEA